MHFLFIIFIKLFEGGFGNYRSNIFKYSFFVAKIALGYYLSIFEKIYMVILTLNVYLWFMR